LEDEKTGLRWLKMAAKEGNPIAKQDLESAVDTGQSVNKSQ